MRQSISYDNRRIWWVLVAFLIFAVAGFAGCSNSSSAQAEQNNLTRAELIGGALERIQKVLVVQDDGYVAVNTDAEEFNHLSEFDYFFGTAVMGVLNERIDEGRIFVNPDLSVEWLVDEPEVTDVTLGDCKKHWWGEECTFSVHETHELMEKLKKTHDFLYFCEIVPVLNDICTILEAIGLIPLMDELAYCDSRNYASTLKVTWIGVGYFKCDH